MFELRACEYELGRARATVNPPNLYYGGKFHHSPSLHECFHHITDILHIELVFTISSNVFTHLYKRLSRYVIAINKIERELKQGRTRPLLCLADDGDRYVVKGTNTIVSELVKEWIVAHLAKRFGLPIPPFQIAWLDDLLTQFSDWRHGYCFASKFQRNIQDVTMFQLSQLPLELKKDIYMFDYWIKNGDRNLTQKGGNPNLFYEQASRELFVIDHNLAFDPDFDITMHKTLHACADAGKLLDLVDRQHYENKFDDALTVLQDAIKSIPDDWLEEYDMDSIEQEIIVRLGLFKTDEFWEGIK